MKQHLSSAVIALMLVIFFSSAGSLSVTRPEAYLKTGNKIVFSFFDHRDKDVITRNHTLMIQKVWTENGRTNVEGVLALVDKGEATVKWLQRFACDSLNFYVYAVNWCYVQVDADEKASAFAGDTIVYPLHMKIGDVLPDAKAYKNEATKTWKGQTRMEIVERKVEGLDTLDLGFGTVTGFRIVNTLQYTSVDEEDKYTESRHVTEWFNPAYGILRKKYDFVESNTYTVTTMEVLPK